MTIEEKLDLITETLDTEREKIKLETVLSTLDEWDSMGIISTITMLDRKFKKVLSAEQIENLNTVQDIIDRMEE